MTASLVPSLVSLPSTVNGEVAEEAAGCSLVSFLTAGELVTKKLAASKSGMCVCALSCIEMNRL